jgi:hypothetical protein
MIETGKLNTSNAMVNWRFNYEIYYVDGSITIMGHETLQRLITSGAVHLLEEEHVLEDQISALFVYGSPTSWRGGSYAGELFYGLFDNT